MYSSVGVLTRLASGRPMNYSSVDVGRIRLYLPKYPDRHWDPHILLSRAYLEKTDHRVKLPDSEAYPVSWLISYGAKLLLPLYLRTMYTNAITFAFNKPQKPAPIAHCDKFNLYIWSCRCRWPRGLRCRSSAAHLLGLWVRIPPGSCCLSPVKVVCCETKFSATG